MTSQTKGTIQAALIGAAGAILINLVSAILWFGATDVRVAAQEVRISKTEAVVDQLVKDSTRFGVQIDQLIILASEQKQTLREIMRLLEQKLSKEVFNAAMGQRATVSSDSK